MKILKLLINKLIFFFFFLFLYPVQSNEPVDIWSIDQTKVEEKINTEKENNALKDTNNTQTTNQLVSIEEDQKLAEETKKLYGIYDPAENDFSLNMWEISSKEKILKIVDKISKLNLSKDAKKIYNNIILTNTFIPKSFEENEFLKIKVDWLIKNKNLELIDEFILNNNNQTIDPELLKFYVDEYLSEGKLENSCKVFNLIKNLPNNIYTTKFRIYCLIFTEKNELAQVQFDLLKEAGFEDKLFEEQFYYLMGLNDSITKKISEDSILDFHLSRITNKQFEFTPEDKTNENIWRYLKSYNLLENLENIDIDNDEKIISIENATHNKNYSEKDLLKLYTRYRFSITELIDIENVYKSLPENQGRALLYQGILLSKDDKDKIKLLQILHESFKKSKIENAFNQEFIKILEQINEKDIPNKYKYFYNYYLTSNNEESKKIKYNNKILHQSKLIKYFEGEMQISTSEKELKKMLKKIKANKKYFISLKDKIVIESLISDGLKLPQKDQDLLELNTANIPTDIEVMINDGELAMIMLRLVEIIGEDNLVNLGTDSLYFIITTLNKLNVDKIRNEILLEVLPLKA